MMRYSVDEAATALGVHRNTVHARIKRGLLQSEHIEENGQRRTYVILTPEELAESAYHDQNGMRGSPHKLMTELEVARERCRGLEELVATLREQLDFERARYGQIYEDVRTGRLALPSPRRRWWHINRS